MFGKRITLFKLLGFSVHIDMSWIIIAVLITWTLAQGFFPAQYQGFAQRTYWWMGIMGALGLFLSIIFHELSHSIVARRYGLPIKGITLFIFGGVAEMQDEPVSPKVEFMMAIAGPIASIAAGLFFAILTYLGNVNGWPQPAVAVFQYLFYLNLILAAFNLVPAFPLDGGRVLRSALWKWKNNLRAATETASKIGSMFGAFLIALGVLQFLAGNFIGGAWWFMIGLFMRGASQTSYQQLLLRQSLEGEKVSRFMNSSPVTVNPSLSVSDLVDDYVYRYHHKLFPVVSNSHLLGCVTTKEIKELPREKWDRVRVEDIADSCSDENTIDSDTDTLKALQLMKKSGRSRLLVLKWDRLQGIISMKDMLKFFDLKLNLEQ
jgi:Zn-dependent protease/CBS domain-containing protein